MNRSEAGKLGALVSAKYQAKQKQKRIEEYTNNQESNLILLCPNCHAMTPNYKFIGSRKGRSKSIL